MANKNLPANDFAPAWLKIPTYNNYKPSGASSERGGHTSRRDEHSSSFTRHKENDALNAYPSYFKDIRRDRDEFENSSSALNNFHYYGVDNGFNGSSCNSQTVLSRRPHSRHDFRISLSYSKQADNLAKHMSSNGGGFYSQKCKGNKMLDGNCGSNNGSIDGRGIGVTSNNFNQEFPSLQGDISEEPTTPPPTLNGSAWEKPRNITIHNNGSGKKIQLTKKPTKAENSCESSGKSPASSSSGPLTNSSSTNSNISNPHIVTPTAKSGSLYRALTPAKNTLPKKPVTREAVKLTNKKSSTTPPPSIHSMEILVKHPKAPGNKSEFLKTLRNEKKENDETEREFTEKKNNCNEQNGPEQNVSEEPHMNGIDMSKLSFQEKEEKSVLSSSLEAEERLLRQMGWKGEASDDENYAPLTEDELREFRARSEKLIKNRGERRKCLTSLSPLRFSQFSSVASPPAENTSTSSSESDSDF